MDGALILDKPAGVSSARILDPLRAALPRRSRIGHAGTRPHLSEVLHAR